MCYNISVNTMAGLTIIYHGYIHDLVQDCSISIANKLEILQSCTEPSIYLRKHGDISVQYTELV